MVLGLSQVTRASLDGSLARRSLSNFVKLAWPIIEPGTPLVWGWHLDAVCDHLQAVSAGHITRLIINIPPRSLKSTLVSVLWPAWEWLTHPETRWLTGSYGRDLALRDATRARKVMLSDMYKSYVRPDVRWEFASDQNVKSRYENSKSGTRICTSVDSGGTGEGGDRIVIDDPLAANQAFSKLAREASIEWFRTTMSTRKNDAKRSAIVLIMQRLHTDDLTGYLLAKGDGESYEHVCLTQEFDHASPRSRTSLGFSDPRTVPGELLCPARMGPKEVTEAKDDLGSFGWSGQHQQNPIPSDGGVFVRSDFRFWKSLPLEFDRMVMSWDLNFKGKGERDQMAKVTDPSFVVGDIWGFKGASAYLIDQISGQWDFATTLKKFIAFADLYEHVTKKLVEAKANGPALENVLKEHIHGIDLVEPHGSKIERAMSIQPLIEAGNIWIPDPHVHPWVTGWLDEVTSFPLAKHNDKVDTMSQALIYQYVRKGASARAKMIAIDPERLLMDLQNA